MLRDFRRRTGVTTESTTELNISAILRTYQTSETLSLVIHIDG